MNIKTDREAVERLVAEYRERVRMHDELTGACADLRRERTRDIRDLHEATVNTLTALFARAEAAEAEVARLSTPPDALALVAAAYRDAGDQCRKERRNVSHLLSNPPQSDAARMIAIHIAERTPADAQAALTAIERAAYERGVRAMADMAIAALAVPQIGTVSEIVRDVQRALLTQEGR